MIKEAIEKIVMKQDLTYEEAYTVMNEIMNGETTPTQNAAFLAALSTKSAKAETMPLLSITPASRRLRSWEPAETAQEASTSPPLPHSSLQQQAQR